jgi:uncharacterized membrane protein
MKRRGTAWSRCCRSSSAWVGENYLAAVPTALYGVVLLAAACAYYLLQQVIIASEGEGSTLKRAVGRDWKGRLSPVLYICGIISTAFIPWIAQALYVIAALIWLVPDRRIERALRSEA